MLQASTSDCRPYQGATGTNNTSQSATGTKWSYDDVDGDDEELDYEDYDDESDVNSLLGAVNQASPDPQKVDEEDVLDEIHASLDKESDVGTDTNKKIGIICK